MKLLFVGDVMLGRLANRALKVMPAEYPWGNTLDVFRSADARFCNLECAISDRGARWSPATKAYHFRSDAKNVEVLKRAGIDAVSLANNHIFDFDETALRDTLDILDRNRIHHAGAGCNAAEAEAPAAFRIGDKTAAFFAFTDNEPGWKAAEGKPGIHYLPADPEDRDVKQFRRLVEQAREKKDLVVVSAHWGPNWLAEGERARSIAEKMQNLCCSWNTASSWRPGERRLTLSGTGGGARSPERERR
jgi:poly-gamma-glutamate synthesis protein (capsule biosynthesis protein)